ncbi:hypothetical protein [Dyadobacter pollutisoli]|uniref:Uncharacterized protein n=1 Tax=Dyadobacter pollutisoli TaxID=2910158 RepID=A0A9E8N8K5_9BACT|nr:hypothetical protein [Dyadobacter pollutisoli]WAC11885.1 hypothetical protein ON006_29660 [Dyadobacter pollutisoli]
MGWTKQEEKVLKSNGFRASSSEQDKYVGKNGYRSAEKEGSWTKFGNGDKTHNISLSRLDEKTRK